MAATLTDAFYRRLHASHVPTEDFYRKDQPRDKGGRWSRVTGSPNGGSTWSRGSTGNKMWSGVSAHPTNRTRPTPKITIPLEKEDYTTSDERVMKLAKSVYDADLGSGYHSTVVEAHESTSWTTWRSGMLTVRGYIMKGKTEVASFERTFTTDKDGSIAVSHDELILLPSHQNKGLGDRFNTHAVARYQDLGVDRITLTAGDTVGGYAWARQGFRLNESQYIGENGTKAFLDRRLDNVKFRAENLPVLREHKSKILKEIRAVRRAIAAGEDVQPIHIASIGEKYARFKGYDDEGNEYTTWPGKSSLIGTTWKGVYYFDAAEKVSALAASIEHAELRLAFKTAVVDAEFACYDESCRPPTSGGTGGSKPRAALQRNRGARPGYGPTALRDVTLSKVKVTYNPDYPDDHPDPGEIVWAKVPFEDDPTQSKDRPLLVIGRINGSTKLAAIQMTSQVRGRSNELAIGTGSWDRQGRPSALKLDRIIQIDPTNYRREGSVFDRKKFDTVIGRLAAYHRTPVQIAASAYFEEFRYDSQQPRDKEGQWTRSGYKSITDQTLFHPGAGPGKAGIIKHLGSIVVANEMTDTERTQLREDLDIERDPKEAFEGDFMDQLMYMAKANLAVVPNMTVGLAAQMEAIADRYASGGNDNYNVMDLVQSHLTTYEGVVLMGGDVHEARQTLHRKLEEDTGISVESGFVNAVNRQWAVSAMSEASIAMHLTIASQFELAGAMGALRETASIQGYDRATALVSQIPRAFRAVAGATYRTTQNALADNGVSEVTVYRGVTGYNLDEMVAQPNPLSSWTTNPHTALSFADGEGDGAFKSVVPARQVYSLANLSGTGSTLETEVLVIGDRVSAVKIPGTEYVDMAAADVVLIDVKDYDWLQSRRTVTAASEFAFDPRQPRDKEGKWTVGFQHVASKANAEAIMKDGFSLDTPRWDHSFGDGVYLAEAGDAKSAKFYARQGHGREWRTAQVINGTVSLTNPLHIEAREHSNFRAEIVKALGGTEAVRVMAQARFDHTVAVTRRIVAEEVGADHGVNLDHPGMVNWYAIKGAENHPDTIFVSERVEAAQSRIHERIKQETGGSPMENESWHWLAKNVEKIAKPGVVTSSDNNTHYSQLLGNFARDAGYDGIVINTKRWGGVGGQQIVVFDPSTITVSGVQPYAQTGVRLAASAYFEDFYDKNQPRDKEGQWTVYRSGITSLSQNTLDRAINKGVEGIFGEGQIGTTPWPRAPRVKGQPLFNQALVDEALRKPPVLEKVDPRTLYATQPGLTRGGVEYYGGDEYHKSGKTYADQDRLSNAFPIIYVNRKGQHIILTGHHRAAADLVAGWDLDAIVVRE